MPYWSATDRLCWLKACQIYVYQIIWYIRHRWLLLAASRSIYLPHCCSPFEHTAEDGGMVVLVKRNCCCYPDVNAMKMMLHTQRQHTPQATNRTQWLSASNILWIRLLVRQQWSDERETETKKKTDYVVTTVFSSPFLSISEYAYAATRLFRRQQFLHIFFLFVKMLITLADIHDMPPNTATHTRSH